MIHKQRKINSKYNTKDSHQTTRGENKRRREEKKNNKNKSKAINKMPVIIYISITTLNVNGLNAPTKRHRLDEWIHKQRKINSNTTLKIVIKPEEERTRDEGKEKRAAKTNPK